MALIDKLKEYKLVHWVYNLIHYKSLAHNREAYRKYGIHKSLTASISSRDFPDKTSRAWLDTGDSAQLVPQQKNFLQFPEAVREQLLNWSANGYLAWKNFFDDEAIRGIDEEISGLVQKKKLIPTHDNKLMFANRQSGFIRSITTETRLIHLLSFILGVEVVPFQTINFIRGSNQRAHSDSIHMTTYPLGYLIAVWIALEDTTMENGPLFYYPGSHRLPYLLNEDFQQALASSGRSGKDYRDYEDVIEETISQSGFPKEIFLAKKGDIFVWHANLVHGGSPVMNPALTRKSMVIHYYAKEVIKYHEFSERPSLLQPQKD